ncbi:MAG: M23 family metallopeptidase, partial [Prevotella sp.]|nr:M23 family metallopeptidase [Prevotella sp.]
GLAGVRLDNKGTNYIGQAGARARAIFDGEVSAIFQLGSNKNILVRHGSYISVYCNLSSVIVTRGQQVKARDILGTVAPDGDGNYVLHFQLRKETAKLNPEAWIGR